MIAFSRFRETEVFATNKDKHEHWLEDYQGLHYSISENGKDKILWQKEKEKYIYSKDRFSEKINKIQRHPKRIIVEFDEEREIAQKRLNEIKEYAKSKQWGFIQSSHNSKNGSDYLWFEFNKDLTDEEAKKFLIFIGDKFGGKIDLNFFSSEKRFPVLFATHWKYPQEKELPIEFNNGEQIDFNSLNLVKLKVKTTIVNKNGFNYQNYQAINNLSDKSFNILNINQLLEYETPQSKWRVNNLLQDKKIIVVAGSSATYKSWLALNLTICVAKGIPFLDNFPTEQGGVLFIDRENSLPELQNRIFMLLNGLNISKNDKIPLFFLSEQSFLLDDVGNRAFLSKFIEDNKIVLVVIDTYRRVINFEENDANSVSLFFTQGLKPICEQTNASFILIHHHKKITHSADSKELLRGSSDLVNFVDGVIQISRRGNQLTFLQSKNRSAKEIEPFDLEIETDEEEFFRFKYLGVKQDFSIMHRAVKILSIWLAEQQISEFKTMDAEAICKQSGIKRVNFYAGLSELEKRGFIQKLSKGIYKKMDLGDSSSSTLKRVERLNYQSPNKSNRSNSSIEQSELLNDGVKQ